MKKVLFNVAFLAIGLLSLTSAIAQDDKDHDKNEPKYKKSKNFSKSYSLSSSDKVSLTNQFGEMKISTWDKNEVKVDATITGKSDDESRVQEILDNISIEDKKDGNMVSFKTKFANDDKKDKDKDKNKDKDDNKKHRNEGMEINYTVYLPSSATLIADNQFGSMIVPDYRGEADITSKFGSLKAGKLSNAKEVTVEFGTGEIEQITGGKLNIRFSSGQVNKLSGDIKTNLEFSRVKLNLDNDVKNLDVKNSYSTVYLDANKNFSASYDISTTHGDFSNKTSFSIKEQGENDNKGYGPKFSHQYSGTSGSGGAKLKMNSSFGEIILGHDLKFDVNDEKDHDKSGKKTRNL
jgi:hypothetical protein